MTAVEPSGVTISLTDHSGGPGVVIVPVGLIASIDSSSSAHGGAGCRSAERQRMAPIAGVFDAAIADAIREHRAVTNYDYIVQNTTEAEWAAYMNERFGAEQQAQPGWIAGAMAADRRRQTWVLLMEAAPGGWGLWGHAHTE